MQGLNFSNVPAVGNDPSQVVGIVLFNFAFITTIPSIVNSLVGMGWRAGYTDGLLG